MTQKVIIETPGGSRNKYKLDEQTGRMKFSKVLPEGMAFPFDFGYFPDTKSEDGDPLDVLVLNDAPTFPGCQVDCRLVGVLLAFQRDKGAEKTKKNDRIIAVAQGSVLFSEVQQLADLPPEILRQLELFFVNYQSVRDVEVTACGRDGPETAKDLLEQARQQLQKRS
jgi:inorganic pyrophosphatase